MLGSSDGTAASEAKLSVMIPLMSVGNGLPMASASFGCCAGGEASATPRTVTPDTCGRLTVIENGDLTLWPSASVTETANVLLEGPVGVPPITPAALNVTPAGILSEALQR